MQLRSASLLASSVAAALMLAATPVIAADTSGADKANPSQASSQSKPSDARAAKDAEKAWEEQHRASKVIGTDVVNAKGEKVGKVKDLVLDDPTNGQVTRVVVSVGGVGGLGDKLFAVPYNALQRDTTKNRLVLNGDSDLAHAFNDNNWQALSNQAPSTSANASATPPASSNTTASTPPSASSASMSPGSSSASASSAASGDVATPSTSDTATTNSPGTSNSSPGANETTK